MCLGIPGELAGVPDEETLLAAVDVGGVRRPINMALLADESLRPGDWVLVHMGCAMSRITESDAQAVLAMLHGVDPPHPGETGADRPARR